MLWMVSSWFLLVGYVVFDWLSASNPISTWLDVFGCSATGAGDVAAETSRRPITTYLLRILQKRHASCLFLRAMLSDTAFGL
eukprot:g14785.t1